MSAVVGYGSGKKTCLTPQIRAASLPPTNQELAPRSEPDEAVLASTSEEREERSCCVGGNVAVVAGVLYKWVNYGKGWRSRWFVLQDGVLSYYKVHGPDKITVGHMADEKGIRVIGEDSLRRAMKDKGDGASIGGTIKQWKAFGEIHLKVTQGFRGIFFYFSSNFPFIIVVLLSLNLVVQCQDGYGMIYCPLSSLGD